MMQDISSDEQKSLTVDRPLLPSQLHFQLAALLLMHFIGRSDALDLPMYDLIKGRPRLGISSMVFRS